jgi:protein-tyrosine phosphatase
MAEMIFKDLVRKENLSDEFFIDSAGTSDENVVMHLGIYPKTKEVLRKNNIQFDEHYARQLTKADYDEFDYIICMEENNVKGAVRIVSGDSLDKIQRLFDFGDMPRDIDDPWYHRDFDRTYDEITTGCKEFLKFLHKKHNFKKTQQV